MAFKDLPNDSIVKTLVVAVGLCLLCSIFVSVSAVYLKPQQEKNKLLDKQKNIVQVAGLELNGRSVQDVFKDVEARVVDLQSGEFADHIEAATFDHRKATKDPKQSVELTKQQDLAGISRLERYATVYIIRDTQGKIAKLILPVRGYGLWSTLWGFLALEGDANTVVGLAFYEQKETPGLGGEVDNPAWKALWPGKKVYDADGDVALHLVKGGVDSSAPGAQFKVDALSGATLTSNGVSHLVKFWMGEQGFAPFLRNLTKGQGR